MFTGVASAAAVEPPVIVSTHTMTTSGAQLLVKAPGTDSVYSAPTGGAAVGVIDTTTDVTASITISGTSHREFDVTAGGLLYVTSSDGVDVIDTATNMVVGFFPAPAGVTYNSMVVNPANGNLYVASSTGVVILSPVDGTVLGSFTSTPNLQQLSINPSTGVLYAVDAAAANVVSFGLATGNMAASSTTGNVRGANNPNGVVVDSAHNRVVVISQTGVNPDSVSVFDGTTLALINTFPVGANVQEVGYMPQSELVVVTFGGPIPPALVDVNAGVVTPISVVAGLNRGLFVDQDNEFAYVAGTTNRTLTIIAVPATIVTTTLPNAPLGEAYSETIDVQGSRPINFTITDGSLPPGLTLDANTGDISGTTTVGGVFTFTVTATNDAGSTSQEYTIRVGEAPVITTPSLPSGSVDDPYSSLVDATGSGPITFTVTAGTLPAGLVLNAATGEVTGSPTAAGTSTFTVTATNALGADTHEYTITVLEAPVITTPSVPNGTSGSGYSATVAATGSGPITFAVTTGTLPPGLVLNPATGVITGTPTTPGTFPFTVTATNAVGDDTQEYTIVIAAAAVTPPAPSSPSDSGSLAITGGSLPWVPLAGGVALAMLGGAVLLRRRFTR